MTPTGDRLGKGAMYFPEPSNTDPSCPAPTVWKDVAAGAISEEAAMPYLRHAATCHPCSDLLAETLDPDTAEATPEEEAFLQQLTTSSPTAQHRLAAMMFTMARPVAAPVKAPRKVLTWPVMTLAAAAALAIAGFIAVPLLHQPADDHLIAQAYDHNRLSELRIPGSKAVALASPTRGAGGTELASDLLEIKLKARKEFEKTPNDPALRQKLGEIAIVEHDGEAARRQFEMAEALNPNLPRLKFDLANAYFELAETNNHPLDYARAIDFFGQYLQSVQQKDEVALFDRGLCWERQSVNSEAIKDFEAALALETDAAWRKEIQRHIDKLKAQSALDNVDTPYTPGTLLALTTESPGDYENFLDAAGRDWLPHRGSDPQTAAALQKLAAIGAQHRDLWLHDFLAAPAVPAGDGALSEALQASARGDADAANAASAKAVRLYEQGKNPSGTLRARAEHVYSLQRMGHAEECLKEAAPLHSGNQLDQYVWMGIYLDLEVEACNKIQGKSSAAWGAVTAGTDAALQSDLPIIELRKASFLSAVSYSKGDFIGAWAATTSALSSTYQVRKTSMRRYQFLDNMDLIAAGLDLKWTQAGLAEAAAGAALETGDIRTAAYALEGNGAKQLGIGNADSANANFLEADQMLARLGSGVSAEVYRADWQTDRGTLTAAKLGPAAALASMSAQEGRFRKINALYSTVNFYTEFADLERRAVQKPEAVVKAWIAVGDAERLLTEVRNTSQRPAWLAQTDRAYRMLALTLANSGEADTSLRAWEWYRGVSYRTAGPPENRKNFKGTPPVLRPISAPAVGSLTLVYARLEDRYVVWTISSATDESVRMQTLFTAPDLIEIQAQALHRLCADPNSSQDDIALLGRTLGDELLGPVADQVDRAGMLELDLDGALTMIPFAAIQHKGTFIGLIHPLLILPSGWAYAPNGGKNAARRAGDDTLPTQPHLLIVRQTIPASAARIPEEYDETASITERFPQSNIQDAVLQRSGNSLSFSGGSALRTAAAGADILHYTGHGLDEASENGSSSATSVMLVPGSLLRCRLAILAACRTFDQRESVMEDVPSFTRIVLEAGASRVLATQWDVDSRMTHKLMVRLYAELADHQSFAEALRRAQQSLLSDPASAHPYFWSAFQLVGHS